MPIKTSQQLFGDDGANGPRAPITENPAVGLGADNRAVAFNEELTSFVANRTTYALSLNDDDLDRRVTVFENGGLDTVYRLGTNNVAGGGRLIHPDGGAVETRVSLTEGYAYDIANAHWRATMVDDQVHGAVGFDIVSTSGVGQGDKGQALFSLLDRRVMALNNHTIFADPQPLILNPNHEGPDTFAFAPASNGRWSEPEYILHGLNVEVLFGVDMVEILESQYAGLYVLAERLGNDRARLLSLSGEAPIFGSDTAVTARLCRPVLSAAGRHTAQHPSHGVRIVGLAPEAVGTEGRGALEIDVGSPSELLVDLTTGLLTQSRKTLPYALRTRFFDHLNTAHWAAGITARGGFEATGFSDLERYDTTRQTFGGAGYRYTMRATEPYGLGYLAEGVPGAVDFRGAAAYAPENASYAERPLMRTKHSEAGFFYKEYEPDLSPQEREGWQRGVAGNYLQVLDLNMEVKGVYTVNHSGPYGSEEGGEVKGWMLAIREINGDIPHNLETNTEHFVRFLSGAALGRMQRVIPVTGTTTQSFDLDEGTARAPEDHANVSVDAIVPQSAYAGDAGCAVFMSANQSDHGYFLRGVNGPKGESFLVTTAGLVSAQRLDVREAIKTSRIQANDIQAHSMETMGWIETPWLRVTNYVELPTMNAVVAGEYRYANPEVATNVPIPIWLWSTTWGEEDANSDGTTFYEGWKLTSGANVATGTSLYYEMAQSFGGVHWIFIPISSFVPWGAEITSCRLTHSQPYVEGATESRVYAGWSRTNTGIPPSISSIYGGTVQLPVPPDPATTTQVTEVPVGQGRIVWRHNEPLCVALSVSGHVRGDHGYVARVHRVEISYTFTKIRI